MHVHQERHWHFAKWLPSQLGLMLTWKVLICMGRSSTVIVCASTGFTYFVMSANQLGLKCTFNHNLNEMQLHTHNSYYIAHLRIRTENSHIAFASKAVMSALLLYL